VAARAAAQKPTNSVGALSSNRNREFKCHRPTMRSFPAPSPSFHTVLPAFLLPFYLALARAPTCEIPWCAGLDACLTHSRDLRISQLTPTIWLISNLDTRRCILVRCATVV